MRLTLTFAVVLIVAGTAAAQFPTQPYPTQPFPGAQPGFGPGAVPGFGPGFNPNNFMPNIFNPQYQPISPYMNLLRGGNTAANYFYGVRPGTIGLGGRGFGGAPFVAAGGNRMMFFPQLAMAPDPLSAPPSGQPGDVLPPAGHPVVFNNTMGFFPGPLGQAGGSRPGLAGLGAMRHK
jgi:hypothetical protein